MRENQQYSAKSVLRKDLQEECPSRFRKNVEKKANKDLLLFLFLEKKLLRTGRML